MPAVMSRNRSRRRNAGRGSSVSMPPQCRSQLPSARRRSPSARVALPIRSSTAGKVSRKRSAARASTVSVHGGVAVTRNTPVRPDRAASMACSAAWTSCRMRRARSTAVAPSAVRRTPCGRRSNSFPPKRCSSRAMSRVSVGCVTFERLAAAPIVPVSATASSLSKSVRLSNMASFPELGRPAACSLGLHVGVRRRHLNRLRAPGPARLRGRGRNRGFPPRRALRHTRCVWILPQTAFSFCTSCR